MCYFYLFATIHSVPLNYSFSLDTPGSVQNFPDQGSNLWPLQWKWRVLITELSGNSISFHFNFQEPSSDCPCKGACSCFIDRIGLLLLNLLRVPWWHGPEGDCCGDIQLLHSPKEGVNVSGSCSLLRCTEFWDSHSQFAFSCSYISESKIVPGTVSGTQNTCQCFVTVK